MEIEIALLRLIVLDHTTNIEKVRSVKVGYRLQIEIFAYWNSLVC